MQTGRLIAFCVVILLASATRFLTVPQAARASALPPVVLSADAIHPRPIEQRTGEAITHDYAQAWQDLADALATNQVDLLNNYFTGEAKRHLTERITAQQRAGVRTQSIDAGHKVRAVFYSPDGGEMQLEDQAKVETKVFDGSRQIYSANSAQKYLVLMTPGADRWYVRSLESVPDDAF